MPTPTITVRLAKLLRKAREDVILEEERSAIDAALAEYRAALAAGTLPEQERDAARADAKALRERLTCGCGDILDLYECPTCEMAHDE